MFGSTVLDVGIGLIFIYLVFGLVCTAVNEYLAQVLSLRSENLYHAIEGMFQCKYSALLAHEIFAHPLVQSMSPNPLWPRNQPEDGPTLKPKPPQYMPSYVFSLALTELLDLHPTPTESGPIPATADEKKRQEEIRRQKFVADIINKIETSPYNKKSALLPVLRPLVVGAKDIDEVRKHLEIWYESTMDRANGWYKKRIQSITLMVAFGIVLVANADSVQIVQKLWSDPAQRAVLVSQANTVGDKAPSSLNELSAESKAAVTELLGRKGPFDPRDKHYDPREPNRFPDGFEWLSKLFGLAITTYAVSLGAPFWFDVLNKFMSIRNSGNVPGSTQSATTASVSSNPTGGVSSSNQASESNAEGAAQ